MKDKNSREYKINASMWRLANAWIHHYYPQYCKCHFHMHSPK